MLLVALISIAMTLPAAVKGLAKKASSGLGPRLDRIFRTVEGINRQGHIVADIGCDHGLLSSAIASLGRTATVFASDVSVDAAKGCLAHFESLPLALRSKVHLLVGDGIHPLLDSEDVHRVDTIILSGMGVRSVFEILSTTSSVRDGLADDSHNDDGEVDPNPFNGKNRRRRTDYWKDMGSINNTVLDQLGVTTIITQPWPPNFLPLQSLYSCMLRDGAWEFDNQGIDMVNGYHQITTSFRRSDGVWGGSGDDVSANLGTLNISCNPLFKRSQSGSLSNEETTLWRDYLLIQRESLIKRKQGLELSNAVLGPKEHEKTPKYGLPHGDIEAILDLIDSHTQSIKD